MIKYLVVLVPTIRIVNFTICFSTSNNWLMCHLQPLVTKDYNLTN